MALGTGEKHWHVLPAYVHMNLLCAANPGSVQRHIRGIRRCAERDRSRKTTEWNSRLAREHKSGCVWSRSSEARSRSHAGAIAVLCVRDPAPRGTSRQRTCWRGDSRTSSMRATGSWRRQGSNGGFVDSKALDTQTPLSSTNRRSTRPRYALRGAMLQRLSGR